MPRVARVVFPGVPHHVTQRGNRRGAVFFNDADCLAYLCRLRERASRHGIEVLAYCLMPNHVHLVVVPRHSDGLHRALKPVHMEHAQRINRALGWTGHLWQGRFFSSPLDESYLWAALRYVELNPVRAGLVDRAERYRWSSAAAHCLGTSDPLLTSDETWTRRVKAIGDWSRWLGMGLDGESLETLRRRARKGLPCGSDLFIEQLEQVAGRPLKDRPPGRQPHEAGDT
jgi:putative transposase